jgi:general secretion pathway protein K
MKRDQKNKRALILIAVLWLLVILSILSAITAQTGRLDTRVSISAAERIRCKWAHRAAVETAIAVLNDDETDSDSLDDIWCSNIEDFNNVQMDMCRFTVEVTDEAGKLNINTASKNQLMILENMTSEIVESILDWRDEDDDLRTEGAEAGYYINLPHPYRIRNGNFKTVCELLRVKGVQPELLLGGDRADYIVPESEAWAQYLTCYSYDLNKDADGGDRVNINTADEQKLKSDLNIRQSYAKWIVENRPKDNYKSIAALINKNTPDEPDKKSENSNEASPIDMKTFRGIVDKITLTDEKTIPGRVNVNTATKDVLVAMLSGRESLADDIIAYRLSTGAMITVADMFDLKSVTKKNAKDFIDMLTTRSNVFSVESLAKAETTGVVERLEAVVVRDSTVPAQILYWNSGANN